MIKSGRTSTLSLVLLIAGSCAAMTAVVQQSFTVLTGAELTRVVPPGFYFQGLNAPTQMRNAAAARFGEKRFVVAGLVKSLPAASPSLIMTSTACRIFI